MKRLAPNDPGIHDGFVMRRIRGVIRYVRSNETSTRLIQLRAALKLLTYRKDVGRDTYIDRTVQVLGWRSVSIGSFCAISEGTWINVNARTPDHKHVVIGDNCYIGRRNFFTSGWQIYLSDYCMTGVDCKLMGGDHSFGSPFEPYVLSDVTNDKVIRLGVNARLGAGASVIGNVSIGHGSIIGAGALVNKDIPPFSIAIGAPCRVYRRFNFITNEWAEADSIGPEQEAAMPDEATYHGLLKSKFPGIRIPLQAAGRSFGDMF